MKLKFSANIKREEPKTNHFFIRVWVHDYNKIEDFVEVEEFVKDAMERFVIDVLPPYCKDEWGPKKCMFFFTME
jgi:hypothetical protein